jgi:hypothetical protein
MFKCSVSGTGFVQTNIKVQGRDKGSSVAFDYDTKIMTQRTTAISTQYTVCKKRTITNVRCDASIPN